MKKTNVKERGINKKGLIKNSAAGALLGIIITMAMLFLCSVLLLTGTVPSSLRDPLILLTVIAGATVSGLYCAGRQGRGVVTAGLASSAAYVVLILICTVLFKKNSGETALTLKIIIAAVAGGCFGGVLKLHRKRKKSKLRR